ncbi:unnamed protein product [Blepharisma stoltei]|uniref:Uncharacterized protein n=1 Tax=Blepharisma stoltei TaxID=1481888 RepID=A0AAU9JMM1_9CILI|nr:unnamed protein product [Blepharisma stoltei]
MANLNPIFISKCSIPSCDNEPVMSCDCTIPKSFICEAHLYNHIRNGIMHENFTPVLPREKISICLSFLRDQKNILQESIKTVIDDYTKAMIKIKNELDQEIQNLTESQDKVNKIIANIHRNYLIPNRNINQEILKLEVDKCLDFLRSSDLVNREMKQQDERSMENSGSLTEEYQSNRDIKEEGKEEEKAEIHQIEIGMQEDANFTTNRQIVPDTQNNYQKLKRENFCLTTKNQKMLKEFILLYKDYLYYKKKSNNIHEGSEDEPSPRKIQKVKMNLCHSIFHWNTLLFFEDNTKTLLIKHFDIFLGGSERKVLEKKELVLQEPIGQHISMCQLPDEEVFCFGNCYDNNYTGLTFTVHSKNFTVHTLPKGTPIYKTSTCYYDGCVYAFGGERHGSKYINFAEKYNISEVKWHRIKDLPVPCSKCTVTAFNGNIYITGWNYDKVYLYNPAANDYSPKLELTAGLTKILFCKNTQIYVLQEKEVFIWNKDTDATTVIKIDQDWTTEISYKTLYGKNLYFACENGHCFKYNQKCLLTPAFTIFDN